MVASCLSSRPAPVLSSPLRNTQANTGFLCHQKENHSHETFLSWNGLQWRSNEFRTHLANECVKINWDKAQRPTEFKTSEVDAEMPSVVLGKELGDATLPAQGLSCFYNSLLQNKGQALFSLSAFLIKEKILCKFLLVIVNRYRYRSFIRVKWWKTNFWKAELYWSDQSKPEKSDAADVSKSKPAGTWIRVTVSGWDSNPLRTLVLVATPHCIFRLF